MTSPKRTAVVVGTRFGANSHVPALRMAGYEVAGLVGRDFEKTRDIAARIEVDAFAELGDALVRKPHVVAVASPPHTHAELTRQAFAAGAHVVCEKPFTHTLEEALELRDLAAAKGLVGLLCHQFRYIASTALFARLLDEGAIGEPRLATFVAHGGLAADVNVWRPEWWFNKDQSGGWFGASGSHGIDQIRDWYGEVDSVSAQLFCAADRPADFADDTFDLHFRTKAGLVGTFQSTAAAWGPPVTITRAVGPGGAMWIEDPASVGILEATIGSVHVAGPDGARIVPIPDDLVLPDVAAPGTSVGIPPLAQLYRDLRRMMDGEVLTRCRPRPATFADGCANMRVMEAVRRSAANRGAWETVV